MVALSGEMTQNERSTALSALRDGRAKGVALLRMESGNGAYVALNGVSTDPTCGRLTIPWS